MREGWNKLFGTFRSSDKWSAELREEMQAHLEMSLEEEGSAARRKFGNAAQIQEQSRDAWLFRSLETLLQDVRYGLRGVRNAPGFSLVVILTLALGIGANTAIFSVVDRVLIKAAPYPNGERLVWLGESTPKAPGISVTWLNYLQWRDGNHSFQDMAIYQQTNLTLTGRQEPLLTHAGLVSANFFPILGAQALLGRTFTADEDQPGAGRTVVLAHAFWAGKLSGDPNILGASLALNGKAYQVIGIAPPSLQFFTAPVDYYLPVGSFSRGVSKRNEHGSMRVLGLLKPGITLDAAMADLNAIMRRLAETDPGSESDHQAYGAFLGDHATRTVRPVLLVLMGAVGLVLILACANVASLVLARSTARVGEIAVRSALGAGRVRLVRQLLTENLLLAASGGVAGVLLAWWGLRTLVHLGPRDIPRLAQTTLNPQVLLFAAAITILTGVLVGLAPIWTASRLDLAAAIKDLSRTATGTRRGQAFRSLLVVCEIAITLVLAFGSGLLLRSLAIAQNTNPGFVPENLLAMELVLPSSTYRSSDAILRFYDQLSAGLLTLPGVSSVGSVLCPPSAGDCRDWFYSVPDHPAPARGDVPVALLNTADADYFQTLRIPMAEGRAFAATDTGAAPRVAIVNQAFARKWWPREAAVGRRVKLGGPYMNGPNLEIVGVASDVSQMGLDSQAEPEIYLPQPQDASGSMVVLIRTAGAPGAVAAAARQRLFAIDRNLPVRSLQPFEKSLAATLERRRFITLLLGLFAGIAMVLAAVGVCGLLNYWVHVREGEIAIRMVLGAPRGSIVYWVGRQALFLALAGASIGSVAAWASSSWIASMVFGVSARNPLALLLASITVVAAALVAAAAPVWRATRINAARKVHQG